MSDLKAVKGQDIQAKLDELQRQRIQADSRMQCKVCWFIYDPAEGCDAWGVPPGTPFTEVPKECTCPDCDHPLTSFLPIEDDIG